MSPLAIAISVVVFVVVVVIGVRLFVQRIRAQGRTTLAARFTEGQVLMSETLAQSFGLQSRGPAQLRGNGALALTSSELFFAMYVPASEMQIPLASILEVTMPRGHLGKTQGVPLLHVRFTRDGDEDAMAWRVPSPESWKTKIDALIAR